MPTPGPLNRLPRGWQIDVSFMVDAWPTVQIVLTQSFGRVRREGHGDADNLDDALANAVEDVLKQLEEAENAAV